MIFEKYSACAVSSTHVYVYNHHRQDTVVGPSCNSLSTLQSSGSSVEDPLVLICTFPFSNVVEKCVTHASRAERAMLIDEVCSSSDR